MSRLILSYLSLQKQDEIDFPAFINYNLDDRKLSRDFICEEQISLDRENVKGSSVVDFSPTSLVIWLSGKTRYIYVITVGFITEVVGRTVLFGGC
ncbi:hypothetical protein CEXT_178011 [Caerostris extrusa]|uniref:Uncharacterized protein n=1 Tax=Caerostris extrusa TaxID=172846 RepID=A0AAV4NG29_CAEEX|nr:hypothetical protein CEXT_178011 [Caerostris extrusa]